MDNSARAKQAKTLTLIGIGIMLLVTLTKIVPSSKIAGYSVLVGIAFFFIVEAVAKTPDAESGLRFKTLFADLKKRGVPALRAGIVGALCRRTYCGRRFRAGVL